MTRAELAITSQAISPGQGANTSRATIGIVDAEKSPSGMTRYVLALLDGIDREEFDLVLFCRADGPYQSLRPSQGLRIVHLPGDTAPTTPSNADNAEPRAGQ